MSTANAEGSNPPIGGSRRQRLRSSHSYGVVLFLIVLSVFFTAAAPAAGWSSAILTLIETAILVAAIWTSGLNPPPVGLFFLSVAGLAAALTAAIFPGEHVRGVLAVLNLLLLLGACAAIAIGVADQGEVNRQSILGAVSVYVALGMLYTFAYGGAAALDSGPFFAQGTDGTPAIRLYFSFVTLATLGYGDYTPANNLGRMLAVTEAILGQLYLVTVLAVLVGNIGRSRRGLP